MRKQSQVAPSKIKSTNQMAGDGEMPDSTNQINLISTSGPDPEDMAKPRVKRSSSFAKKENGNDSGNNSPRHDSVQALKKELAEGEKVQRRSSRDGTKMLWSMSAN